MENVQRASTVHVETLGEKMGIPRQLSWGYLGILIFMMGDGMEQGWLSPYLIEHGMSIQQSATLFTVYGITIVSGVSSDRPKVFTRSLNVPIIVKGRPPILITCPIGDESEP